MEFGSFDPKLSAMMNLSYAGTHLNNGQPDNDTACVTHFDQAGFVMGSSASLFNVCIRCGNHPERRDIDNDVSTFHSKFWTLAEIRSADFREAVHLPYSTCSAASCRRFAPARMTLRIGQV